MRYDKRCTIVIVDEIETPLGLEETKTPLTRVCSEQNISLEEQNTFYGQKSIDGIKLHFPQRITEKIEKVQYEEETYNIVKIKQFRRKTVLYLSRSGHSG